MGSSNKIRFGVLGCSRVAYKGVLPAIIASDCAELVMIGSRDTKKAAEWAREFEASSSGTYEEVLGNKNIDAVYLSLPNSLHEEWVLKAAAAGKHVYMEKPAALTYASAKKMVAACKAQGVRLMEGFMFLAHPQHARARTLIREGTLGDLVSFTGAFTYPAPERASNRFNQVLAGGSYHDAAVYPIRASRMIFEEEPVSVVCNLTIDEASGVDVKADLLLTYPHGRSAHIESAFGAYFQSTYGVLGSTGSLHMERAYAVPADRPVKIFLERNDQVEEFVVPPADQFRLMLEEFCAEVRKGSAGTKRYEEDLLLQARVLNAGRKSHEEQRTVLLSEIT